MPHDYFQELLQRYQRGECTPAEQRRVEHWYETLGQEQELTREEQELLRATLWQRIAQQTTAVPSQQPSHRMLAVPYWVYWAAAVLALGFVGIGAGWLRAARPAALPVATTLKSVTPSTSPWQTRTNTGRAPVQFVLPDGSTVALDTGSTLQYPRAFRGASRSVRLVGKALFDVTHKPAQPFRVLTANVVTTVLGTRFVVRAYTSQPDTRVEVQRGRVRVRSAVAAPSAPDSAASVVVLPNQQAVYSPARQTLARELVAAPALLQAQSFAFNDRPVAEVLTALTQAYGVPIGYDKELLAGCTVRLVLPESSLFDKLNVLCKTLGASYEQVGARIVFHSRGCSR